MCCYFCMVELKLDLLSLGALERKEFQICVKYAAYIEGQGVILLPRHFVGHWPIHFSHCSISITAWLSPVRSLLVSGSGSAISTGLGAGPATAGRGGGGPTPYPTRRRRRSSTTRGATRRRRSTATRRSASTDLLDTMVPGLAASKTVSLTLLVSVEGQLCTPPGMVQ